MNAAFSIVYFFPKRGSSRLVSKNSMNGSGPRKTASVTASSMERSTPGAASSTPEAISPSRSRTDRAVAERKLKPPRRSAIARKSSTRASGPSFAFAPEKQSRTGISSFGRKNGVFFVASIVRLSIPGKRERNSSVHALFSGIPGSEKTSRSNPFGDGANASRARSLRHASAGHDVTNA